MTDHPASTRRPVIRDSIRIALLASIVSAFGFSQARAQDPAPNDLYGVLRVADSLYASGDRAAAIEGYERFVRHVPDHSRAWYRLGRAYESAERWRDAAEALERAHALPYRFRWWIAQRIAGHYARLGERDLALDWLARSLADGYEERSSIADDPRFEDLRGTPRFERLAGIPPGPMDRVEGWRYDLAYLVAEVDRIHVTGPKRPPWPDRFEALADSIHARIPDLDDVEVILELKRLLALLGDGHTGIYGPGDDGRVEAPFPVLPVLFYRFAEGLHVVDGEGPGEELVGDRIVRIGELDPDEVLRRLDPYVHRDNAMTPVWLTVRFYLTGGAYLRAVGATDDPGRVQLVVERPDGSRRRVALPTGDHEFRRKLRHPPGSAIEPPLWLREVDVPYHLEPMPDLDAVWFQFNQVRNAETGPSLAAFADTLRHTLGATDAEHLIVDVRHNNGGNSGLLRPLVRTMIGWETDRPGRWIWVVTGRNTFSATQSFITQVERWTDAVFVGEPSSSSPNFSGEETSLVLPWSGVRGSVSSRYFQDSGPLDDRQWIDVDLPVALTAGDFFAGRDPVMEAIAEAIRSD